MLNRIPELIKIFGFESERIEDQRGERDEEGEKIKTLQYLLKNNYVLSFTLLEKQEKLQIRLTRGRLLGEEHYQQEQPKFDSLASSIQYPFNEYCIREDELDSANYNEIYEKTSAYFKLYKDHQKSQ